MRFMPLAALAIGCVGCSGSLKMDRSTDAFNAGDMTLLSSCQAAPGPLISLASGVDSCRFTVGDIVAGKWILIAPPPKNAKKVIGGSVDLYYRDLHKAYPITDWTIPIDFKNFLGNGTWSKDFHEGVIEALVSVSWVDNQGIQQITRFRGIAVLIVTDLGYERLAIDSGNQTWGTSCKVQYTNAGRGSVVCR